MLDKLYFLDCELQFLGIQNENWQDNKQSQSLDIHV